MRKLLFLCTANYYRSRFAEMLFNRDHRQLQLHEGGRGTECREPADYPGQGPGRQVHGQLEEARDAFGAV